MHIENFKGKFLPYLNIAGLTLHRGKAEQMSWGQDALPNERLWTSQYCPSVRGALLIFLSSSPCFNKELKGRDTSVKQSKSFI